MHEGENAAAMSVRFCVGVNRGCVGIGLRDSGSVSRVAHNPFDGIKVRCGGWRSLTFFFLFDIKLLATEEGLCGFTACCVPRLFWMKTPPLYADDDPVCVHVHH